MTEPTPAAGPPSNVDPTHLTSGSFEDFGLPEHVLVGLAALGYTAPTPVQHRCIAPVLTGHDLIVQSKTGSGKTSAFGIPLAALLAPPGHGVQALVLAPTRELAAQDARELAALVRPAGHEALLVIGGVGFGPQTVGLRRGDSLVVGTPGRVLDQLRRGTFDPAGVRLVVLDEADEMLSMGFWEEVTAILDRLPRSRQTLLFSATLPEAIQRTARQYLVDPQRVDLAGDHATVRGVAHLVYFPDPALLPARQLLHILEVERPQSALVFCATKNEASGVGSYLRRFGLRTDVIHGDLSQPVRERAMRRLRTGAIDLLVATDVAARGIDISGLSHVVNFGLPEQIEIYVHRVGRTGRIGQPGTAITLLSGRDTAALRQIERTYDVGFQRRSLPAVEEVVRMQAERIVQQLLADSDGVEFEQYVPAALSLVQSEQGRRAVAYLLRAYFAAQERRLDEGTPGEADVAPAAADESDRRPPPRRRSGGGRRRPRA